MESLDRKITVLEPNYVKPIYIVQNSNMFPIRITIIDWTIPSGAVVYWQVRTSTKGEINDATVENNTVVIEPYISSFNEAGKGYLQIRIEDGNDKLLVSFAIDVYIQEDHVVESEGGNNSDYIKKLVVDYVDESVGTLFTDLEAQAQSELASIRATGDAVIASIPSDYTALEQATYNAYPTESETGNPICFDDGADNIPVKELIVNLEPQQEGSGDPSPTNVRPITGYDGVTIKRNGRNLCAGFAPQTYTSKGITSTVVDDGEVSSNHITITGTSTDNNADSPNFVIRLTDEKPINLKANTAYVIRLYGVTSSPSIRVFLRTSTNSNVWYGDSTTGTWTFTPTEDVTVERVMFRVRTSGSVCNIDGYFQIEVGSTPTEYEPYTEQEYSITFPSEVGTVYGGSLNVTTGELTVDRAYQKGFTRSNLDSSGKMYYLTNLNNSESISRTQIADWVSNYFMFESLEGARTSRNKCLAGYNNGLFVGGYVGEESSLDELLSSLEVVYKLRASTTYQLTPTEVSTLLGINTIQSDGSMELQYRADTTKVIEKLTNAIISMGGNV